jgi:N-acetylneuraminic acid mutarotase
MLAPNAEFSTSVVNRRIYAIGGLTPAATGFSRVEEYDPATDTWRKRADMPTPRWGLSTSVVNGKIYAIGGTDVWIGTATQGLQTVEEYDPVTDTWRKRADMPTARYWFSASVVDGKIYAIGGWDGTMPHSTVEEYDPVTDTWTRKANMPTPRWALSTSMVNGKIYAIGGGEPLSIVEEYDPATDTWTRKADMPTPRFWFTTSAVNGKIYAIGGKQSRAPEAPSLSIVEEYDTGFVLEEKGKSVGAKGKLPATWGKVK